MPKQSLEPGTPNRVVHIVRDQILAGSQRVSLSILAAPELKNSKKVLICGQATGDSAPFLNQAAAHDIQVIQVKHFGRALSLADPLVLLSFIVLLAKLKPDLVHTHSAKPFLLGGIAAFLCRVPVRLYTIHGVSFHDDVRPGLRHLAHWAEQLGSLFYTALISVNEHYVRYFRRSLRRGRITVVPNGVPSPPLPQGDRQGPGDPFTVIFVGRLDEVKNPVFMLKVAKDIVHQRGERGVRFSCVGDGPLRDEIEDQIYAMELRGIVELHGWVNDVSVMYTEADVILLPSRREACGLVLLEAGNYGCPAVAARVEGVPEVVHTGVNGFLFEPGDVENASSQILSLAQDPCLYVEMSSRAREVAGQRTEGKMVEEYLAVYRSLLKMG